MNIKIILAYIEFLIKKRETIIQFQDYIEGSYAPLTQNKTSSEVFDKIQLQYKLANALLALLGLLNKIKILEEPRSIWKVRISIALGIIREQYAIVSLLVYILRTYKLLSKINEPKVFFKKFSIEYLDVVNYLNSLKSIEELNGKIEYFILPEESINCLHEFLAGNTKSDVLPFQETDEIKEIYVPESMKNILRNIEEEDIIEYIYRRPQEVEIRRSKLQDTPLNSMVFKGVADNFGFTETENSALIRLKVYHSDSQALINTKEPSFTLNSEVKDKVLKELKHKKYFIDMNEIELIEMISSDTYKGSYKENSVLIKLLISTKTDKMIEDLLKEINALDMKIEEHSNVLKFEGIGMLNDQLAIITEYYEQSLYQLLHDSLDNKLTITDNYKILKNIASGIAELHSSNIVCQNLTSHNIFVNRPLSAKLGCYGPLRFLNNEQNVSWLAPEVLRNQAFTIQADAFTFGVLLWEILARLEPYEGLGVEQIINYVSNLNGRPSKGQISSSCPPQVLYIHH